LFPQFTGIVKKVVSHHYLGLFKIQCFNGCRGPTYITMPNFIKIGQTAEDYYTLHMFNGPLSGTTQVSQYQKGKTNLDFTEARDSEWQWHQLHLAPDR